MPRALTIKRTVVTQPARKEYLERLRVRRDYYQRASCNFWVFEEAGLPGAFIEFTEATDAAVRGDEIVLRKQYNVGIAVALDWGLIVPVIKNADDLSLTGLTRSLNDLANRARAKKLQPAEVQGATFTITNPGVFGSLMGTPIIPVPTSGIMGVGAIEKRPKVVTGPDGEDTIAVRTCSYFSISFDHRIVDGSDADRFMASVKKALESFPEAGLF